MAHCGQMLAEISFCTNLDSAAILTGNISLDCSAVLSTSVRFFQIPLETRTQSLLRRRFFFFLSPYHLLVYFNSINVLTKYGKKTWILPIS